MSLFLSCQNNSDLPNHFSEEKYLPAQKMLNVSYGRDSLQRMDVYLPEGRSVSATKSLVLIHGGGWTRGSRAEFAAYIDSFQKRFPDYAIFNLDYRLVNGGNLFPTQEMDVKAAIEFISNNARQYAINKNGFVFLGASAGGHLAALNAYKYFNQQVQAVVNFFGPTDLVTMYQQPWHPLVPFALQMVTGTSPVTNLDLYKNWSPVTFVDKNAPPTLMFHGALDKVVDVSQSKLLQQKLNQANVPNELVVYPKLGHGWHGKNLTNSFDKIEKFLKEHVK